MCVQGLLLTAYLKLLLADPGNADFKASVEAVFDRYSRCDLIYSSIT